MNGVAELKRGDDPRTRAFFLPPYCEKPRPCSGAPQPVPPGRSPPLPASDTVFQFQIEAAGGAVETLESFTLLPIMISRTLSSRTNDNVELEVKLQVQFEVEDPTVFAARPLNPIHTQVLAWGACGRLAVCEEEDGAAPPESPPAQSKRSSCRPMRACPSATSSRRTRTPASLRGPTPSTTCVAA